MRMKRVLQIWQSILEYTEDPKRALSMLWGGHLRFFRQLVSLLSSPWQCPLATPA